MTLTRHWVLVYWVGSEDMEWSVLASAICLGYLSTSLTKRSTMHDPQRLTAWSAPMWMIDWREDG